ncbi:hypothetical protein CR513_00993, partial [Mucuna pruriens]
MNRIFLEKFFPASRTATIRKEICGIRQQSGEILHEYWERLNKLCATYPYRQISLSMMDKSMIHAASGGALMDKTLAAARIRGPSQSRMVNEICAASNLRLENQLSELTSLVRQRVVGQHQPNMVAKYGKQPYQNRPFDNQQYGRQPFRPGPNQGPYAAQRFVPTPNVPQGLAGYQQPSLQYQALPFQQQQQQRMPPEGNSPSMEDLMNQQFGVPTKYEHHHLRPQDADRTVSQHCEPFTVSQIQQPSLTINSKSEREHKCSYAKKWKRIISTSTAAIEINRSQH